ncbi:MAG TPA: hypothetical protein VIK72_06780 [Clostridiaceae bacterium]
MSKHKIFLLVIIIPLTIILISIITYFAVGVADSTVAQYVKSVMVSNETIKISGTTVNSGEAFTGYSYTINKDTIYLKLRYSIVNPIHKSGDFNILINNNFGNIKYIYMQGKKTGDRKLIWTK